MPWSRILTRLCLVAGVFALSAPGVAGATTTVRLISQGSIPGDAIMVLEGDGAGSRLTVQRTQTDQVEIAELSTETVVRDETDPLTTTYCANDGLGTSVYCVITAGATAVVQSSDLGDGADHISLIPGLSSPDPRLEVNGGAGDDEFTGGPRGDTFDGGEGSDTMRGNGGADFFGDTGTGPSDVDTVSYNDAAHAATGVTVNMDDGFATDGADGVDVLPPGTLAADQVAAGIDRIEGTDFADVLVGSAAGETFLPGLGADTVLGQGGTDRIEARDGVVDSLINCGDQADVAVVDATDPTTDGCETVDRPAGAGTGGGGGGGPAGISVVSTQISRTMPDLTRDPYSSLAVADLTIELRKVLWAGVRGVGLSYAQAAARAGKGRLKPYQLIAQSPNPGAGVSSSAASPLAVSVFFWDPAKDARKQPCDPSAQLRPKKGKAAPVSLTVALRGMEYREGSKRNEGEAQELLRQIGCDYDARISYSLTAETATVTKAKAATLNRNGKSKRGFLLYVKAPRNGNDFLVTFSEALDTKRGKLPVNERLQLPLGEDARFVVGARETATGRIADGALVELAAPGGEVVAAGKTGVTGLVTLTAAVRDPGAYKLYVSRSRTDPVTRAGVFQGAVLELAATRPSGTWRGVSGTAFTRKGGVFASAAAARLQSGLSGPQAVVAQIARELAAATGAAALADAVAARAGLSSAERDALAQKYATMLGLSGASPFAALLRVREVRLLPAIGATQAGRMCPQYSAPPVSSVGAVAPKDGGFVGGRAEGAAFGCGRAVLIDPTSGLTLLGGNHVLGTKLIANDGASILSDHGAGLIANDGASLIANDGASLIANDGASLVPVTRLLANDGASLIANDGASLQPLGAGTTFMASRGG